MHYAVVRRRAKLSAQHRVIFAIPYNAMQYDAMQYHAMQSKTIQYMQYKEIPCNTLFKSFETSTGPMGFVVSDGCRTVSYRVPQKKCPIAIFSLNLFQRSDYTFSHVFRNQNSEPVSSKHIKHPSRI